MTFVCHLKAKIPHAHDLCSLQWFMGIERSNYTFVVHKPFNHKTMHKKTIAKRYVSLRA